MDKAFLLKRERKNRVTGLSSEKTEDQTQGGYYDNSFYYTKRYFLAIPAYLSS